MVSMGGNLLMNVGPTARGEIDTENVAALKVYSDWFTRHERAIRGCGVSEFKSPVWLSADAEPKPTVCSSLFLAL